MSVRNAAAMPGTSISATLISFLLGNTLGALAGYYRKSRILKILSLGLIGLQPIPYYVLAFILLILFGFVWPVLPITAIESPFCTESPTRTRLRELCP